MHIQRVVQVNIRMYLLYVCSVARFSAGVRKAKGNKAKKSIANKPLEYWFLTTTSARPNENIRVKFVSLADYQVRIDFLAY